MADDHPIIEHIKSFAADPKDGEFDSIVNSFAGMPDPFRSETLNKMRGWVAADDGVSLRQRAQLFNLSRHMNTLHQSLRKAGR